MLKLAFNRCLAIQTVSRDLQNLSTLRFALLLIAFFVISGCDKAVNQPDSSEIELPERGLSLSAYRVRSDSNVGLNEDVWDVPLNTPATVNADEPFRLRLELENLGDIESYKNHSYSLQYRRNNEAWEDLTAEKFPYPNKEVSLDFSVIHKNEASSYLKFINGNQDSLTWQENEEDTYLRLHSDKESLLVLGEYNTHWKAEEFKAVMRLSKESKAGLVFGFQDANNYHKLLLEGGGPLTLIERREGVDTILDSFDIMLVNDRWFEIGVTHENNELIIEYEWDPIIEGMEWSTELDKQVLVSSNGIYVPKESYADVKVLENSAEARTPCASIIQSSAYMHGEETSNLLEGSALSFVPGSGVNSAPITTSWAGSNSHGEWEFPIVLRYFADGPTNNLSGDRFEFRVLDESGNIIVSKQRPLVSLRVPDGHLGGTFVETPGRLGPWQTPSGDMYFLMEPSETDNKMMIVKSSDGGKNWLEVDGSNRPETGDLEGVATTFDGERIHVLHQTSDDVLYHVFRTKTEGFSDAWEIRDEILASPSEPPVQVADIALRSDGTVVGVYGDLHKIQYRIRSKDGVWSDAYIVDPDADRDLSGPVLVKGKDDVIHFAYTGFDGTAWYRQILPNGDMTARVLISNELGTSVDDAGGILPLVYSNILESVSVIYRLENGELWERQVSDKLSPATRVSDFVVAKNAADSEQVGADVVIYGEQIHLLFIEESTGRLFHSWRDSNGSWTEPKIVVDSEDVLWVRGSVITNANDSKVYGFIYDGGSQGGSGMNRYREIHLGKQIE